MKTAIIFIMLLLAAAGSVLLLGQARNQIKKMKTADTMGLVVVAMSRTLDSKSLKNYNVVEEAKKMFPSVPATHDQIIDAWGRPLVITIKEVGKGFQVRVVSSGADGVLGTKDDLQNEGLCSDQQSSSTNHIAVPISKP